MLLTAAASQAAPLTWTSWSNGASSGPQTGTLAVNPAITFAFTGNDGGIVANYPSWTPTATFADGSLVDNAPPAGGGIVFLNGDNDVLQTLSFSAPVVNPIVSIWSLGNPSSPASFNFINATPVLVSGGPSAEYNGSSISVNGSVVSGAEGNGTIEFLGSYSSLSWTNPTYENWYGFTVGVQAAAVPEPQSAALVLPGLAALGLAVTRAQPR